MAIALRSEFKPIIFDKLKHLSCDLFFEYSPSFSVCEVKCHTWTICFGHHVTPHYTYEYFCSSYVWARVCKSASSIMIEYNRFLSIIAIASLKSLLDAELSISSNIERLRSSLFSIAISFRSHIDLPTSCSISASCKIGWTGNDWDIMK